MAYLIKMYRQRDITEIQRQLEISYVMSVKAIYLLKCVRDILVEFIISALEIQIRSQFSTTRYCLLVT